jgi:hypothetical protein
MKNLYKWSLLTLIATGLITAFGCTNDSDDGPALVNTYEVPLSAQFSVPANTDRSETGTAVLRLLDDNTLEFELTVNDFDGSDRMTVAHLHAGNLVSNGNVFITLVDDSEITFDGNTASGTVTLMQDQIMALNGSDVYVNLHSEAIPSGLLRGSVDKTIDFAADVQLSPDEEVPPVMNRDESGIALLRLDSDNNLEYKITVNDLRSSDALVAAHVHAGEAGANGDVFIGLLDDSAGFDVAQSLTLDADQRTALLNDPVYVNAHSNEEPAGIVRGQIR